MELGREERLALVAKSLIGAIVQIYEQGFPVGRHRVVVNCKSMVLRCYEALVRTRHDYRLVMPTMTIFKLENLRSGRTSHKLISHTDAADWLVFLHCLTKMPDSRLRKLRRAGAVAYEKAVIVERVEIKIPLRAVSGSG